MTTALILFGVVLFALVFMLVHSDHAAKDYIGYRIKKDRHYSVRESDLLKLPVKLGLVGSGRLSFTFMFNGACCYDQKKTGDELNKLYGMTFGFDVHYRSIRMAWRHIGNGDIQLFSYVYSDGKRSFSYLYTVKPYVSYRALIAKGTDRESSISLYDGGGHLLARNIVQVNSVSDWFRFRLYPYFGGVPKAPTDMVVYIKENR